MQHRPAEAVAHFEQALEKNPQLTEALEQIVATLLSQGKVRQARECVGRQIDTAPNDPKLYNLLGQLLSMSKEFSEAEAAFKKALSLDGTLLPAYANLGELYARQGQIDRAIGEFEAILAKSPQHLPTLMILGMLHEQREESPRATAKYEEAIRLNPQFAPAANNLAWILLERGGDKDRALSYAETAREALPRDPYIADTLGVDLLPQTDVCEVGELVDRSRRSFSRRASHTVPSWDGAIWQQQQCRGEKIAQQVSDTESCRSACPQGERSPRRSILTRIIHEGFYSNRRYDDSQA